jgi:AcrR family transcriptional regulator
MTAAGRGTGRRGRPRSERVDRAILTAALELVAERGYEGLTMEGIAEGAGVGKSTLYRRWQHRDEVLREASEAFVREIGVPDTGSVRGDLLALLSGAIRVYSGLPGRVLPGLVSAMARNPELARSVRSGFLARRRVALRSVLTRAVERGEVRPDVDLDLALDLLGGPLMYRLLVTGERVDERVAAGVVDMLLGGIGTPG